MTLRLLAAAAALALSGSALADPPRVGFDAGQTLDPSAVLDAARAAIGPSVPAARLVSSEPCRYDGSLDASLRVNTFMIIPIHQVQGSMTTEQARAYHAANCALKTLPLSDRLNCQVMATCLGEACRLDYGHHGTAFLVGDGTTLFTAWHVVNETHEAALTFLSRALQLMSPGDRAKAYHNLEPEFILADQSERIVYDTRLDAARGRKTAYARFGDPLSTGYVADGEQGGHPYGFNENIPVDWVQIALTESLGPGLTAGSPSSDAQECFVDAGFAFDSRVTRFAVHSGRRAGLTAMMKASDQFMDFQLQPLPMPRARIEALPAVDALVVMGYSKDSARSQVRQYGKERVRSAMSTVMDFQARHMRDVEVEKDPAAFFLDSPIMSGQSGGPLFNSAGQVCGIVTNGFMTKDESTQAQRSYGGAARRLDSILSAPSPSRR
jgi:hypothetical protein